MYELLCGDCLAIMPKYPDHFDMILTAPPRFWRGRKTRGLYAEFNSYTDFIQRFFAQAYAALKRSGILAMAVADGVGHSPRYPVFAMVCVMLEEAGFYLCDTLVWDKDSEENCRHPISGEHEMIIIAKRKDGGRMDRRIELSEYSQSVWRIHPESPARVGHPDPLPPELIRRLLALTEPGERVLDPFMGSGRVGIGAIRYRRDFVGIEIDPSYFQVAKNAINGLLFQPELFNLTPYMRDFQPVGKKPVYDQPPLPFEELTR